MTLEDLKTEIEQTLKSQKFIEYMKDLRANADVKKMDLPEIKDEDVKTNEEDKDADTKEDSKDSSCDASVVQHHRYDHLQRCCDRIL